MVNRRSLKDLPQTDLAYFNNLISKLKIADNIGTIQAYQDCIKANISERDLSFKDITYGFLTRFESFHYSKGNSANGLAVYMRTIRAIYRKGIKSGLVEKEYYPFEDYKIKTKPTEKRALDWDLIKKVIDINLTLDNKCFDARNYFLASYMMYGINFKDMAMLKKGDISNGRILYQRRKTAKFTILKLHLACNQYSIITWENILVQNIFFQ